MGQPLEVRYPDEFYIPTIDEAKECIKIAKKVKAFVLKMSAEYALKQLGKVKYVVVTNPDGGITTSKLSIPSREQREIMGVLGVEYIKSES